MRTRTTQQWQSLLEEVGVPCAPLWNYANLFGQQQAAARHFRVSVRDAQGRPVDLLGSPFHISKDNSVSAPAPASCPPGLGEHTDEILREICGLSGEKMQMLREHGVIG
jgi:crotonobetainyl-CoA:carnitine CoA-transferase CaiB-like acyl-CoA transferase